MVRVHNILTTIGHIIAPTAARVLDSKELPITHTIIMFSRIQFSAEVCKHSPWQMRLTELSTNAKITGITCHNKRLILISMC